MFDAISYCKGSTAVRMANTILGEAEHPAHVPVYDALGCRFFGCYISSALIKRGDGSCHACGVVFLAFVPAGALCIMWSGFRCRWLTLALVVVIVAALYCWVP